MPQPVCAPKSAPTPVPAHTLRLILGDQLNPDHAWFGRVDAGVVYVLLELRQETDYVLHHARLSLVYRNLQRMAPEARSALRAQAALTLEQIESL
jgi:deoxyribodipyrimidine photolyase-related protein